MNADNVTRPTGARVDAFLDAVEPSARAEDAKALDRLFRDVTGWKPAMWGPSIIGYGRYRYRYDSGREGEFLATGFAPRKRNLVIYIMPGYTNLGALLDRLGKHRAGKSCLYVNKLADIDTEVLGALVRAGLDDLSTRWRVFPV